MNDNMYCELNELNELENQIVPKGLSSIVPKGLSSIV